MKILVFGHSGQVATELRALDGDDIQIIALARADADLTDPAACAAAINGHAPDAVINAAAYTAVDKAESDAETAQIVNADAPAAMAQTCAARDIPFVSISTDYVFFGAGDTPWVPADPADPQGVYGRTKRHGEIEVAKATGKQDWMMWVTGIVGLLSFMFTIYAVVYIDSVRENELFIHLMGMIEGVVIGNIFAYYYGASVKKDN